MEDNNSWNEWSKHVLKELERLDSNDKDISDKLDIIKEQVITLKVKVGTIVAITSFVVSTIVTIIIELIKIKP